MPLYFPRSQKKLVVMLLAAFVILLAINRLQRWSGRRTAHP